MTTIAQIKVLWCHEDHSDETFQWFPYSSEECDIIEDAFNAKKTEVELNWCIIDLTNNIQINKECEIEQSDIKRIINVRRVGPVRSGRFRSTEPLRDRSFADSDNQGNFRGFVWEWYEKQCQQNESELSLIIEKAAHGILIEGTKYGEPKKAEGMAKQLRALKGKDKTEITQCCVQLYTENSFLYKMINQVLRDDDKTKLDTLGPYCYLLKYIALLALYPDRVYERTVYRSASFNEDQINQYKNAINDPNPKQWLAFSSTTKSFTVADFFGGNTLFIIQLPINEFSFGIDISSYSQFPTEEEVLLPTQICFKVERVQYNQNIHKHLIYLNMNVFNSSV